MAIVPWRRWEPFNELELFHDRMNELFDEVFGNAPAPKERGVEKAWHPAVDIYEEKDNIVLKAELPGVKKEDVTIEVKDDVLTLKGERRMEKETKEENYHRVERSYGQFIRSFNLPSTINVAKVKASYKDGILEITLPKVEKAKPKAIPIKVE